MARARERPLGGAVGGDHQRRRGDLGDVLGDRDPLRVQRAQDGGIVDEVSENREWTGVGALERERDGVADAEAHAEMDRSQDTHSYFMIQSSLYYNVIPRR